MAARVCIGCGNFCWLRGLVMDAGILLAARTLDGESFSCGCSASKKQAFLSFLRKAVAADGPAPDALALLAAVNCGTGRRLLGTSRFCIM